METLIRVDDFLSRQLTVGDIVRIDDVDYTLDTYDVESLRLLHFALSMPKEQGIDIPYIRARYDENTVRWLDILYASWERHGRGKRSE